MNREQHSNDNARFSYTIRPAGKEDLPFLREMLYQSIYVPEGSKPPGKEIVFHPDIAKYVEDWGRDGDAGFVACDSAGRPVGSATFRLFDEAHKGYGYVDRETPELGIAIVPAYRGQGIGTMLMTHLLAEARKRGIKSLSLSVDPRNPAVRLYERFGFARYALAGTSITMKVTI